MSDKPTFEGEHLVPQVNTGFNADFVGEVFDHQYVASFVCWQLHLQSVHPASWQHADNSRESFMVE